MPAVFGAEAGGAVVGLASPLGSERAGAVPVAGLLSAALEPGMLKENAGGFGAAGSPAVTSGPSAAARLYNGSVTECPGFHS